MAKLPKQAMVTKKHLARLEREKRQTRYIMIGAIVVLILAIGSIAFGYIEQKYLFPTRAIATVNGDKIILRDFQAQVRYRRWQLVNQANQGFQFAQSFGNDPQMAGYIASQLSQIQTQLSPTVVGQNVLDQMVQNVLIKQEAQKRGIKITQADQDTALQEGFGYYAHGTPTTAPTSQPYLTATLNPTQIALIPPTPTPTFTPTLTATQVVTQTATPTVIPSPTPTSEPTATATPYNLDGYKKVFQETLTKFKADFNFSEQDINYLVESGWYYEKLKENVLKELAVPKDQEEVWARHILVKDEQTAKDIEARLQKGEDFTKLATEYSTDTSSKDRGGDVGWFKKGDMNAEFEKAAFALNIGEISQPVQTQYGWHIIQALGHQTVPLSDTEYNNLETQKFQEWLQQLKDKSKIDIKDFWKQNIPATPALSNDILNFLQQQTQQQQQQQQPVVPTP